ncbi:MAG: methylated-DNA--[protein]-cysteine S-methyltransferase [Candidatus Gracilibacteria bacterium]
MKRSYYNSPVGILELQEDQGHLIGLYFRDAQGIENNNSDLFIEVKKQLDEYFVGKRSTFTLPLKITGTPFQEGVWNALLDIPYGETRSYLQQAQYIQNPKAVRAVGTTNGKNKISIIIPCHRVIGKDGSLTGYGGELWRKKWLLEHEKKYR